MSAPKSGDSRKKARSKSWKNRQRRRNKQLSKSHSNHDYNNQESSNGNMDAIDDEADEIEVAEETDEAEVNEEINESVVKENKKRKRSLTSQQRDTALVQKIVKKLKCEFSDNDDNNPDNQFFKSIRLDVAELSRENKVELKCCIMAKLNELLNKQKASELLSGQEKSNQSKPCCNYNQELIVQLPHSSRKMNDWDCDDQDLDCPSMQSISSSGRNGRDNAYGEFYSVPKRDN